MTADPANGRATGEPDKPIKTIYEIGAIGLISRVAPERAKLVWIGEEDPQTDDERRSQQFNLKALFELLHRSARDEIDFIVVYPATRHPPWHWRPLRSLGHRPLRPWQRFIRLFGIQALRLLPHRIPLFVVDYDDMRTVPRFNVFLLDRCRYYFKRELPIDRWQVFQRTVHPEMPSTRFRERAVNRDRIAKLRPWSIGFSTAAPELPSSEFPEKTIDLFVSLAVSGSSTVRMQGLAELRELAKRNDRIFIADRRLPRDEFLATMARAWLTWSPEGFGWDCFRHYEAGAFYSVPVINQPTIVRDRPLRPGEHAFYYDADIPGSLSSVVEAALGDRERLKKMAIAAHDHVATHHVFPWRQAARLLRYAQGLEVPPGGMDMI